MEDIEGMSQITSDSLSNDGYLRFIPAHPCSQLIRPPAARRLSKPEANGAGWKRLFSPEPSPPHHIT